MNSDNRSRLEPFKSTIVSMIEGMADDDPDCRRRSLDLFFRRYRAPLISHIVARFQIPRESVEDLFHDFLGKKFLSTNEQDFVERYQAVRAQSKVKFRTYLASSFRNFVIDHFRKLNRQLESISLPDNQDFADTPLESTVSRFDVSWANNLILQAIVETRENCESHGQQDVWQVFKSRVVSPIQDGVPPKSYRELHHQFNFKSPKEAANKLVTAIRKFNRSLLDLVESYIPELDSQERAYQLKDEIRDLKQILATPTALHFLAFAFRNESGPGADSLALADAVDAIWSDDDYSEIWSHFLATSLSEFLREECHSIAAKYIDVEDWDGHSLRTPLDLFRHPKPPIDILHGIKSSAKSSALLKQQQADDQYNDVISGNGMAGRVNGLLYVLCAVVAQLRHGQSLSDDDAADFVPRVRRMLELDWIDENTRQLFVEFACSQA